jgi:hypothetical protein
MNGIKKLGLVGTLLGGTAMFFQSLLPTPAIARDASNRKPKEEGVQTWTVTRDKEKQQIIALDFETGKIKKYPSYGEMEELDISEHLKLTEEAKKEGYDVVLRNKHLYLNEETVSYEEARRVDTGKKTPKFVRRGVRIYRDGVEKVKLTLFDKNGYVLVDENNVWTERNKEIRRTIEGNLYLVTITPKKRTSSEIKVEMLYKKVENLPKNAR